MKKGLALLGLLILVGCSNEKGTIPITMKEPNIESTQQQQPNVIEQDDTNDEQEQKKDTTNNPFFFNQEVENLNYKGKFLFDEEIETNVKLNINQIAQVKEGKVYELQLEPIDAVPSERLKIGYFYVQGDKIYKLEGTKENLNQLINENIIPKGSEIVCQEEKLDDELGKDVGGWHHYIEVNGDKREYHSYDNQVDTGYYETFIWERNKGLIHYASGYGAEREMVNIDFEETLEENVMSKENDVYINNQAGFK